MDSFLMDPALVDQYLMHALMDASAIDESLIDPSLVQHTQPLHRGSLLHQTHHHSQPIHSRRESLAHQDHQPLSTPTRTQKKLAQRRGRSTKKAWADRRKNQTKWQGDDPAKLRLKLEKAEWHQTALSREIQQATSVLEALAAENSKLKAMKLMREFVQAVQQQVAARQRMDSTVDGPEILQPSPVRPKDRRSLESLQARVDGLED